MNQKPIGGVRLVRFLESQHPADHKSSALGDVFKFQARLIAGSHAPVEGLSVKQKLPAPVAASADAARSLNRPLRQEEVSN